MFFDLFLPFPVAESDPMPKKKKDKGKNKASPAVAVEVVKKSCWEGLTGQEKDVIAKDIALAGHLGYSVVGCTVIAESSTSVIPSPFSIGMPYPHLDPRHVSSGASSSESPSGSVSKPSTSPASGASGAGKLGGPVMVQVSRFHMRLDDNKTHCLTNANTNTLKEYDILSVQPLSDKALQLACTDLANPGPNQISIITLPLHEKPYHFRLNRKQIKQAQRNGVMLELLYSPGLFPHPKTPPDVARRYRQNFLSNAREIVRITGGKGIIFSSGSSHSEIGVRGPLDVVNFGTMLGMAANLAKDAVTINPKKVLLNAQARRTHKAIFSIPKMVPPPSEEEQATGVAGVKRSTPDVTGPNKKIKVDA